MRKYALAALALAAGVVFLLQPSPVDSASKEIVQLQRDVALLQQQVTSLRQSVEGGNAVLKTLIEQSSDAVNRMKTNIGDLEEAVQKALAGNNTRVDNLATQVQALRDSVDEVGARLGRMEQQMAETRSVVQSLDARMASAAPPPSVEPSGGGTPGGAPTSVQPLPRTGGSTPTAGSVPSADTLYNTALRDLNAGNYDLAGQQFRDYLDHYGETELAGNAQFYLGEIEYQNRRFQSAITEYDKVLEEFPNSFKLAASHLKKGYALLELGRREEGIRMLRLVTEKFPRWDEARLASDRLRRLGERVP